MIRLIKQPIKLSMLAAYLFWELVVSSVRVTQDILAVKPRRSPGIIAVPLAAKTDAEIAWVANLITLTPGSLSLEVSPDRKTLYVHVLFADDVDAIRRDIKEGFERRVLEILR